MMISISHWQDIDGRWYASLADQRDDDPREDFIAIEMIDETSAQKFVEGFVQLMTDHSAMPAIPK